jgi:hypothetical protein
MIHFERILKELKWPWLNYTKKGTSVANEMAVETRRRWQSVVFEACGMSFIVQLSFLRPSSLPVVVFPRHGHGCR